MKNDKKKTMVLVGLGVLLLAVGAFQMLPKGSSTPPPAAAEQTAESSEASKPAAEGAGGKGGQEKKETDPQKQMLLAMVKDPLPQRDPFQPAVSPPQTQDPQPPVVAQQPTQSKAPVASHSGAYRPKPLGGGVAPYNPLPDGAGQIGGAGANGVTPGPPLRTKDEFAYRVKGILNGPKPMAVFEDDSGNQRLVPLGGSVDGDSKVVGIEKGRVRVRHKGKDKSIAISEGQ